jgi:hypothetical protein
MISLKAGGEGLNLQEADHIFIVDPWWNPAAELQAIDRAHRIGQTKAVTAIRFIIKGALSLPYLAVRACVRHRVTRMLHERTHAQPWTLDEARNALPSQAKQGAGGHCRRVTVSRQHARCATLTRPSRDRGSADSIEERIVQLQDKKKLVVAGTLDGDTAAMTQLTAQVLCSTPRPLPPFSLQP